MLSRTFIRLYLLLVLALAGAGWGFDSLWNHFHADASAPGAPREIVELVEWELSRMPPADWRTKIDLLNARFPARYELLPLKDLSGSRDVRDSLANGEMVLLHSGSDETVAARRIGTSDHVLAYRLAAEGASSERLENVLLAAFYLVIAIVVLLWTWPLHRDLRRLETTAMEFGEGRLEARVDVRKGSAVHSMASAFNQMATRLVALIGLQKELADAVSHEFRTPLARMRFALDNARQGGEDSTRSLDSISQDIDALELLVNELLQYAAIERGAVRLDFAWGEMGALLQSEVERLPNTRRIRIQVEANSERLVWCDWRYMERLIQNLLANSMRFAAEKVKVGFAVRENRYVLRVEDDGPGVPFAERHRIFAAFHRMEAGQNRKHRGFGLGLAIVRRIVEWHGGTASVTESAFGGAMFMIEWPVPDETSAAFGAATDSHNART